MDGIGMIDAPLSGLLLFGIGIAGVALLTLRRNLQAERAAHRSTQKRFELFTEYAPIGLALVRHDGTIAQANIVCREMLGYSPEQFATVEAWWERVIPDAEERERNVAAARAMIRRSRETCGDSGLHEMQVTCADGTVKNIQLHYVDFGYQGLWTLTDVTDHYRIEEAARLANDHLLTQLAENRRLEEALREQAVRDPLTTLFNRRYLDETLEREIARAIREGYPVCVAMIDVDHFKRLNDTYGHLAGDEMLKALADLLRAGARQEDIVCRFGGEEFAVILPRMPIDVGAKRANDWRDSFAAARVRFGEFELQATLSAGIAAFPGHGKTRNELIDTADHALYRAKAFGRNRVVVANGLTGHECSSTSFSI